MISASPGFHPRERSGWAEPIGVFWLAFTVRLLFLAARGADLAPDSEEYVRLAANLREHGAFSLETSPPWNPSIRRAPLYPAFLLILGGGAIPPPGWVAATQGALDAGVAVFILLLSRQVVRIEWARRAAFLFSLHPGAILASSSVLSETLFTALVVAAMVLVSRAWTRDSPGLTALGGATLGAAALCRPVALILPAAFLGSALGSRCLKRPWRHGLLLFASAGIVVAPWAVRCSRLAGQFVIVQAGGALNLYLPTRTDWDQRDQRSIWARFSEDACGRRQGAAHSPAEKAQADGFCLRQGLRNIRSAPAGYLASRARALPHLFLSSFDSFTQMNRSFGELLAKGDVRRLGLKAILLAVFSLLPVLLGTLGLLNVGKDPVALVSGAVWVSTLVVHLPAWIEYRFWLPAVPGLLVSAAAGAQFLADRGRGGPA